MEADAVADEARLRNLVSDLANGYPEATALVRPDGEEVTFARLDAMVAERAGGLPEGATRVAVVPTNDTHGVAAIHAAWRHGASAVLVSPLLPPAEAERRIAETAGGALPGEAAVIFTSGTTGRPKGAVLSFTGIMSALRSIGSGIGLPEGRPPAVPARSPSPTFMPLAHIGGFLGTLNALYLGKPLLLLERFRAEEVFDLVPRFGLRLLRLSPAMLHDLAHWPEDRSLAPLQSASVGSAALSEATRRRFEERYGVPVLDNYGQTEFSGAIAFERYADVKTGRRPVGSVGRIAPGVEVRIVDQAGDDVSFGAVGEIWARSQSALAAYIDDGRTVDPRREGWIPTGDLGRVDDDGFLYLAGRLRDVIVCGGFNIYPAMVEAALNRRAGVADSAVVGRPDERLGEVPVAAVALEPGAPFDAAETSAALRHDLAAYEVPRSYVVVDRIPRTDVGKPDRPALMALFAAHAPAPD